MRIWDIAPGFLSSKSLLAEHGELHGIVSIVRNKKSGYSKHPEVLRWAKCINSLIIRHNLLVSEMLLRGINHKSPLFTDKDVVKWPSEYIDKPHYQFRILHEKYVAKKHGRIPIPKNIASLWASHKYSVLARDQNQYREFGKLVSSKNITFEELSEQLVLILRLCPSTSNIMNAIDHMWGYASPFTHTQKREAEISHKVSLIQKLSIKHNITYLLHSTALSDLVYSTTSTAACR